MELRPDELKLELRYRSLASAFELILLLDECLIEPHLRFGSISALFPFAVLLKLVLSHVFLFSPKALVIGFSTPFVITLLTGEEFSMSPSP
jgi:hypothetical protein